MLLFKKIGLLVKENKYTDTICYEELNYYQEIFHTLYFFHGKFFFMTKNFAYSFANSRCKVSLFCNWFLLEFIDNSCLLL